MSKHLTRDHDAAVERRRRSRSTGSAESYAHGCTDEHLESIVADEQVAREAAWLHHAVDRMQRAAELELLWRRETGVRFGWTSR